MSYLVYSKGIWLNLLEYQEQKIDLTIVLLLYTLLRMLNMLYQEHKIDLTIVLLLYTLLYMMYIVLLLLEYFDSIIESMSRPKKYSYYFGTLWLKHEAVIQLDSMLSLVPTLVLQISKSFF